MTSLTSLLETQAAADNESDHYNDSDIIAAIAVVLTCAQIYVQNPR
jgi:hypothetical protein